MTDTPDSDNTPKPEDLESLLGGLDFTPNWAKGEPGVKEPERRERSGGNRGGPHRGPRAPRDSSRRNLQGVRVKPRREQSPRGGDGDRGGRGGSYGGHSGGQSGGQSGGYGRPPRGRDGNRSFDRRGDRRDPRPPRVPVHVDFIPEKKRLSMVMKVIRQSHKVFPLRVVAEKFMENTSFIAMKYTVKDKSKEAKEAEEFQLFVCRANGMVFTDEQACTQYVIEHGIEANYESTSKEVDPPAGNFVCIGRHRPTGRLIGPPNWHGYQMRLAEVKKDVADSTPMEHFTADIEMVHVEEVIAAWKKDVSTQTFYREKLEEPEPKKEDVKSAPAKDAAPAEQTPAASETPEVASSEVENAPEVAATEESSTEAPATDAETGAETAAETEATEEAAPEADAEETPAVDDRPYDLSREQAETAFKEKYLKRLVGRTKRTILPGYLYSQLTDPSLRSLTDYHLRRENDRPNSIIFALRPAFKHMRLHVYRYDGELVVSGIAQHPLPQEQNVAPEIQSIVDYVKVHPGCNTQEALMSVSNSTEEIPAETVSHFRWLIEKGHLLEFHDDTLHLPHHVQQQKRDGKGGKGKKKPSEPPAQKEAAPESTPEVPVADSIVAAAGDAHSGEVPAGEVPAAPASNVASSDTPVAEVPATENVSSEPPASEQTVGESVTSTEAPSEESEKKEPPADPSTPAS